jgi:hypothetical protein
VTNVFESVGVGERRSDKVSLGLLHVEYWCCLL